MAFALPVMLHRTICLGIKTVTLDRSQTPIQQGLQPAFLLQ